MKCLYLVKMNLSKKEKNQQVQVFIRVRYVQNVCLMIFSLIMFECFVVIDL